MKKIGTAAVLIMITCFSQAFAFEKQVFVFAYEAGHTPNVSFSYVGKELVPPLDVLKAGVVKDAEIRRFQQFFKKMYKANKHGTKDKILSIWNPGERSQIATAMDSQSLKDNMSRFKAITAMELRLIVQYANYYICYIGNSFDGGKKFVMKFPLVEVNNQLYLSNNLNGNYFYDNISSYLDKTNFVRKP